jgi:hypothetical protein
MDNTENTTGASGSKFLPLMVVLIVLIALAGFFLFMKKDKTGPDTTPDGTEQEFSFEKRELGLAETLSGFPSDLPMQTGNQVLQNYEAESNDGRLQSTKKFTTSLSVTQALQTYTNFFISKDWLRNTDGALASPVLMRRGSNVLMISVSQDSTDSDTIVEITLTQNQN